MKEECGPNQGSVLQDWVIKLPLRMQGVLLTAVRGCDGVPKEDAAKPLVRMYRGHILNAAVKKPSSFINYVKSHEAYSRMQAVLGNHDHYPMHWLLHIFQAAKIVDYYHPEAQVREQWGFFHRKMCYRLHMNPETKEQIWARLTAGEAEFARDQ